VEGSVERQLSKGHQHTQNAQKRAEKIMCIEKFAFSMLNLVLINKYKSDMKMGEEKEL
jgi:hypothetical protein